MEFGFKGDGLELPTLQTMCNGHCYKQIDVARVDKTSEIPALFLCLNSEGVVRNLESLKSGFAYKMPLYDRESHYFVLVSIERMRQTNGPARGAIAIFDWITSASSSRKG